MRYQTILLKDGGEQEHFVYFRWDIILFLLVCNYPPPTLEYRINGGGGVRIIGGGVGNGSM